MSELVLPLVRGIVMARLLAPDQFGLAISVTLVANAIELISDIGIAQQALRSGDAQSLPTLHAVAILRGFLLSLAIAAAGPFFAFFFHAPGTAWVYSAVGLAPLIRSFSHLDTLVKMRDFNYTPEALTTIGMQSIWTVISIASAFVMPDSRAMVAGYIASAIGTVAITHWTSSNPYRLGWNRKDVDEALRFGRPLAANGVALVVSSVGDRLLIGARISLEQLAQYTALATAAFMPRSVVTKFATSLFVPQFINTVDHPGRRRLADAWVVLIAAIGGVFGFGYMAFGQFVVATAFGKHYLADQTSVSLIAGLACIRYMAAIPTAPSLANGRTSFVLLNTSLAASGLILGAVCLCFSQDLHILIEAMIVGEGAGLLWILHKLRREIVMSGSVLWIAILVPLAMLVAVGLAVAAVPTMAAPTRWALCGCGVVAELVCAIGLLRMSGSNAGSFLRLLLPKRRTVLQTASEPSA